MIWHHFMQLLGMLRHDEDQRPFPDVSENQNGVKQVDGYKMIPMMQGLEDVSVFNFCCCCNFLNPFRNGSVLIVDLGNFKMHTITEERPTGRRLAVRKISVF